MGIILTLGVPGATQETIRKAMEKAGGTFPGMPESKTASGTRPEAALKPRISCRYFGRGERIRTSGLLDPNQALYQAEPRPELTSVTSKA